MYWYILEMWQHNSESVCVCVWYGWLLRGTLYACSFWYASSSHQQTTQEAVFCQDTIFSSGHFTQHTFHWSVVKCLYVKLETLGGGQLAIVVVTGNRHWPMWAQHWRGNVKFEPAYLPGELHNILLYYSWSWSPPLSVQRNIQIGPIYSATVP